jgi:hypothetical protein
VEELKMATNSFTAYYVATVWLERHDPNHGPTVTRQIMRLQATGPEDFKARVRASWKHHAVSFGPVSLSKVQL